MITRELSTDAVFEAVLVRYAEAAEARYREPLDVLFTSRRFEYGDLTGQSGSELPASHTRIHLGDALNPLKKPKVQASSRTPACN
jgi:hypothetical protein